jgi:hypothetical protein
VAIADKWPRQLVDFIEALEQDSECFVLFRKLRTLDVLNTHLDDFDARASVETEMAEATGAPLIKVIEKTRETWLDMRRGEASEELDVPMLVVGSREEDSPTKSGLLPEGLDRSA